MYTHSLDQDIKSLTFAMSGQGRERAIRLLVHAHLDQGTPCYLQAGDYEDDIEHARRTR